MSTFSGGDIDAYDLQNGSVTLAWPPFIGAAPDSYNIYVNGALYENVTTRLATVSGLTQEAYNSSTGVITPAGSYTFSVAAVKAGVEVAACPPKTVSISPASIQLVTPGLKRIVPFGDTDSLLP